MVSNPIRNDEEYDYSYASPSSNKIAFSENRWTVA